MGITPFIHFLGKFHPAVIHFPIALFCIALLAELVNRSRRREPLPAATACVVTGAVFGVLAVALGWLNAQFQSYGDELSLMLFIHRWLGVVTAALGLITWGALIRSQNIRTRRAYRGYRRALVFTVLMIFVGSHFGAVLVHGSDYFDEVFQLSGAADPRRESSPSGSDSDLIRASLKSDSGGGSAVNVSFARDIRPVLEKTCNRCHGKGKSKGDYNIDMPDSLMTPGKSGRRPIVPGSSTESYLYRLVAGLEQKKVMPKKGRRLTPDELKRIRVWIEEGARFDLGKAPLTEQAVQKPAVLQRLVLPEVVKQASATGASGVNLILDQYFRSRGIAAPPGIDDRTFLRRAYLDAIGRLPLRREADQFLSDKRINRRELLVTELLSRSDDYAQHWISFWNDLLRNDPTGSGYRTGGRKELTPWLYSALATNEPFDHFVSQLIAPKRGSEGFIKGILWRGDVLPNEQPEMQAAQNVAQVFLGVNLKCFSCHDHPDTHWKLDDAYAFAGIFARTPLEVHECAQATGRTLAPGHLFPGQGDIDPNASLSMRRQQLAKILTEKSNARLYRTIVNRLWERLVGRAIVEPPDKMDGDPWSQELLDYLALDLIENNFDLRHSLATIMGSRVYQAQTAPASTNVKAEEYIFHGPHQRSLSAEQYLDAAYQVTGLVPNPGKGQLLAEIARAQTKGARSAGPRLLQPDRKSTDPVSGCEQLEFNVEGVGRLWLVRRSDRKQRKRSVSQTTDFLLQSTSASGGVPLNSIVFATGNLPGKRKEGKQKKEDQALFAPGDQDSVRMPLSAAVAVDLSHRGLRTLSLETLPADGGACAPLIPTLEVYADLSVRAGLTPNNPLMQAFGRPIRDQVVSRRDTDPSTLQALELFVGESFNTITKRGGEVWFARKLDRAALVDELFYAAFQREPSKKERPFMNDLLGQNFDSQKIADLLWVVMTHPDFLML